MIWLFGVVALALAGSALHFENLWLGLASLLAIAAAIWDGRSQGMWLADDGLDADRHDSNSGDGGGDGGD